MKNLEELKQKTKKSFNKLINKLKNITDEDIFKLAIVMLPFENFFFAPSSGWAAITPIILFVYMIWNYKYLLDYLQKYKKYILIGIGVLVFNLFISIFMMFNIKNIINVMIPIVLGITLLVSFNIYYEKEKNLKKLSGIIVKAYSIALIIGIIQFISVKLELKFMYDFFDFIFKRNYMRHNRIQFFFTEPSFIGMHLFGVLLPYYLFTKEKNIIKLIITFAVASIVFSSGVRVLLDIFVVSFVFLISYMIRKKLYKQLIVIPIVALIALTFMYNQNYRVQQIVDKGIYADGSLASRYFRIQSSVYGYIENPFQTLIGYGIGNSIIPIHNGYDKAKEQYQSSYVKEVNDLGNPEYYDDSVSYCLYIRFISEFGLIIFTIVLLWIIDITKKSKMKYRFEYLIITLYIYLQFESYAFYALWIYILAMMYTQNKIINSKKEVTVWDQLKNKIKS